MHSTRIGAKILLPPRQMTDLTVGRAGDTPLYELLKSSSVSSINETSLTLVWKIAPLKMLPCINTYPNITGETESVVGISVCAQHCRTEQALLF